MKRKVEVKLVVSIHLEVDDDTDVKQFVRENTNIETKDYDDRPGHWGPAPHIEDYNFVDIEIMSDTKQ